MADSAGQIVTKEATEERPASRIPRYSSLELEDALRQGEVLSGVVEWLSDPTTDPPVALKIEHEFCVVATQDCDLEQDFYARHPETGKKQNCIAEVLLFRAFPADKTGENHINSDLRSKIRANNHPRFQLIEQIPPDGDLCGEGVPELVVDMKQVFSIRREELYRQIEDVGATAKRRARLVPPYRDHLQTKFAHHIGRVGLPEPHSSV